LSFRSVIDNGLDNFETDDLLQLIYLNFDCVYFVAILVLSFI